MREQLALVDARARAAGRTGAASGAPACRRRVTCSLLEVDVELADRRSPARRTAPPAAAPRAAARAARRSRPASSRSRRRRRRAPRPSRAPRRPPRARSPAPSSTSAARGDLRPGPVRQDEVEDHRLRRPHRRRRERRLGGLGRLDLVAGAAQARPSARRICCSSSTTSTRGPLTPDLAPAPQGSASTNVAPWPARDSAQTRPPFASAKPRAIASPSPAPRARRRRRAGTARRSAPDLAGGDPGPVVDDADEHLARRRRDLHAHGLACGRVLERVLDQVHEHALDLVGVDPHGQRLVGERDLDPSPSSPSSSSACTTSSSTAQTPGCGSAAPACSRERSSRLPTRRSSRSASPRIVVDAARAGRRGRGRGPARERARGGQDRHQRACAGRG